MKLFTGINEFNQEELRTLYIEATPIMMLTSIIDENTICDYNGPFIVQKYDDDTVTFASISLNDDGAFVETGFTITFDLNVCEHYRNISIITASCNIPLISRRKAINPLIKSEYDAGKRFAFLHRIVDNRPLTTIIQLMGVMDYALKVCQLGVTGPITLTASCCDGCEIEFIDEPKWNEE